MEAATGFGLACNILQIGELCCKLASTYRSAPDSVTYMTEAMHLSSVCVEIKGRLTQRRNVQNRSLPPQETRLENLAEEAQQTAAVLSKLLEELGVTVDQRKPMPPAPDGSLLRHGKKLYDLREKFVAIQQALQMEVLAFLLTRALSIGSQGQTPDPPVQAELKDLVAKLEKLALTRKKDDSLNVRQLAQVFAFPSMSAAENKIINASPPGVKFDWMFDTSLLSATPSPSLPSPGWVDWLERGRGPYVICGKPGSGKSTLMHVLASDTRTMASFSRGKHSTPIVITHYFDDISGIGNNAIQCCLRDIIVQIVLQLPNAFSFISDNKLLEQASPITATMVQDWSIPYLQGIMLGLIQISKPNLLIFLDGAERILNCGNHICSFLKQIMQAPNVKLCISNTFQSLDSNFLGIDFKEANTLHLKWYVRDDIIRYVEQTLSGNAAVPLLAQQAGYGHPENLIRDLCNRIAEKAEGMFTYVEIITKIVSQSILLKEPWANVERHLDHQPNQLDSIYSKLWTRFDSDLSQYVLEANLMYSIVLDGSTSMLELYVAQRMANSPSKIANLLDLDPEELILTLGDYPPQVSNKSAGLLEITHTGQTSATDASSCCVFAPSVLQQNLFDAHHKFKVRFIHPTAEQFVRKAFQHFQSYAYFLGTEKARKAERSILERRNFAHKREIMEQVYSTSELHDLRIRIGCQIWMWDAKRTTSFPLYQVLACQCNPLQPAGASELLAPFVSLSAATLDFVWAIEQRLCKESSSEETIKRYDDFSIASDFAEAVLEVRANIKWSQQFLIENSPRSAEEATRLLTCVMGYSGRSNLAPVVQIIGDLLACGANPMAGSSCTGLSLKRRHRINAWPRFLAMLLSENQQRPSEGPWASLSGSPLKTTLESFFRAGASASCSVLHLLESDSGGSLCSAVDSNGAARKGSNFAISCVSAARVLRWCFSHRRWYRDLEESQNLKDEENTVTIPLIHHNGSWSQPKSRTVMRPVRSVGPWQPTVGSEDEASLDEEDDLFQSQIEILMRNDMEKITRDASPTLTDQLWEKDSNIALLLEYFGDDAWSDEKVIEEWAMPAELFANATYQGWYLAARTVE